MVCGRVGRPDEMALDGSEGIPNMWSILPGIDAFSVSYASPKFVDRR